MGQESILGVGTGQKKTKRYGLGMHFPYSRKRGRDQSDYTGKVES